nr:protoporphyrinogen oxidase [Portibacter lacus]
MGGGISGLAISLELQSRGEEVSLIEKSDKAGGVLQSIYNDDCYWDRAAHTLAVDLELLTFFQRFNIEDLLVEPSTVAKNRQIVVNDEIHNISNHPGKILTAKFLSSGAKVNLLKELFKKPVKIPNPTVREFFEYHFGKEITENIISAVFSGIYSGDIEKMEMKAVMGNIFQMEQESGSLIRGLMKQKDKTQKRKIYGIKGGMEHMNRTLSAQLSNLELGNEVLEIRKVDDVFYLRTAKGERTCKQLISCLPAYNLSNIIFKSHQELSVNLDEIQYNPMILIHVAFDQSSVAEELNAFGFLCSQYESPVLKGAIYNSSLFPSRANGNLVSYTIFMKPKAKWLDNKERLDREVDKVLGQFQKLTKINGAPIHKEMTIWKQGIPQFNKPYESLKFQLIKQAESIPGFTLSGSYISGVSVPDCIKYNLRLASQLVKK